MNAPIFAREFISLLRKPRTYVLELALVGALLVIVLAFWPLGEHDAATRGRFTFRLLAALELAVAGLVAAAIAAPSIAEERRRETLGLLAIAGVAPLRIVAGKAIGRLGLVVLLIALSFPPLAALITIGGLSLREVGAVFVEAAALAVFGTGAGALFSAAAARSEAAVLGALAAVAAVAFVPLFAAAAGAGVPAHHISPIAWFQALFDPLPFTGEVVFRRWWIAPLGAVTAGAVAIVLGAALLARRGYEPVRAGAGESRIPLRRLLVRLRRRGEPLELTSRFGTEVAAICWRERSARFGSDGALAVLLGAALVAFEALVPPGTQGPRLFGAVALAGFATLVATALGAAAIARERDQKTLEPLAAAPIEAEQFLLGKLLGLGRGMLVCWAALAAHVALGALRGDLPPMAAFVIALTTPFGLVLHAVMGLSFSSRASTIVRAVAASLATAVGLAVIARFGQCLFFGISPASFVAIALDLVSPGGSAGTPGTDPLVWVATAGATSLLAAAVGVVTWNHLRARFDALVGRAALDLLEVPDRIADPQRPG